MKNPLLEDLELGVCMESWVSRFSNSGSLLLTGKLTFLASALVVCGIFYFSWVLFLSSVIYSISNSKLSYLAFNFIGETSGTWIETTGGFSIGAMLIDKTDFWNSIIAFFICYV